LNFEGYEIAAYNFFGSTYHTLKCFFRNVYSNFYTNKLLGNQEGISLKNEDTPFARFRIIIT